MNIKRLSVEFEEGLISEQSENIQSLFQLAKEAAQSAYAPYSQFSVGAAVELEDGVRLIGNNQENAAYPSGLCAERVALFFAQANYPNQRIKRLAVFVNAPAHLPLVPPCGSCLQVIREAEVRFDSPIDLYLLDETRYLKAEGVKQFMPLSFTKGYLSAKK